jgi:hypothetical protein
MMVLIFRHSVNGAAGFAVVVLWPSVVASSVAPTLAPSVDNARRRERDDDDMLEYRIMNNEESTMKNG